MSFIVLAGRHGAKKALRRSAAGHQGICTMGRLVVQSRSPSSSLILSRSSPLRNPRMEILKRQLCWSCIRSRSLNEYYDLVEQEKLEKEDKKPDQSSTNLDPIVSQNRQTVEIAYADYLDAFRKEALLNNVGAAYDIYFRVLRDLRILNAYDVTSLVRAIQTRIRLARKAQMNNNNRQITGSQWRESIVPKEAEYLDPIVEDIASGRLPLNEHTTTRLVTTFKELGLPHRGIEVWHLADKINPQASRAPNPMGAVIEVTVDVGGSFDEVNKLINLATIDKDRKPTFALYQGIIYALVTFGNYKEAMKVHSQCFAQFGHSDVFYSSRIYNFFIGLCKDVDTATLYFDKICETSLSGEVTLAIDPGSFTAYMKLLAENPGITFSELLQVFNRYLAHISHFNPTRLSSNNVPRVYISGPIMTLSQSFFQSYPSMNNESIKGLGDFVTMIKSQKSAAASDINPILISISQWPSRDANNGLSLKQKQDIAIRLCESLLSTMQQSKNIHPTLITWRIMLPAYARLEAPIDKFYNSWHELCKARENSSLQLLLADDVRDWKALVRGAELLNSTSGWQFVFKQFQDAIAALSKDNNKTSNGEILTFISDSMNKHKSHIEKALAQ